MGSVFHVFEFSGKSHIITRWKIARYSLMDWYEIDIWIPFESAAVLMSVDLLNDFITIANPYELKSSNLHSLMAQTMWLLLISMESQRKNWAGFHQ